MKTMRSLSLALVGCVLGFAVVGCPSKEEPAPATCVGQQALSPENAKLFGTSLQPKQLALTFDDGPDLRTSELSTYLKQQGIRAGFFVNGYQLDKPSAGTILKQLVDDGHVVANHTETHLNLTGQGGGARPADAVVIQELTKTDTRIAPYVPANRFMFRAPFGYYDQTTYTTLEASPMKKYVGHIEWDIGGIYVAGQRGADFACWQQHDLTSQQCGDLYLNEIQTIAPDQKGIVLMHDALYVKPGGVNGGNTVDMVKYLVPLLKAAGFTFVRIDEVPAIAALLPPLPPPDAGTDAGDVDAASTSSSGGTSTSGGTSSSGGNTSSSGGSSGANPCP